MAKKFFYVCGGLLMLALAYQLGATTATAQAPGNPIVAASGTNSFVVAIAANGDAYISQGGGNWGHWGNVFGSPVPATQETWGQVKARYR